MARIIDCSMIVSDKMWRAGWKVNISTKTEPPASVEGIRIQPHISFMHLCCHCGTHIDTPLHMIEGGKGITDLPIDNFFGEAAVVDLTDKSEAYPITAEDMEERGKHVKEGDIVLLKTGWTEKNAGGNTENMEGLPKDADYCMGPYPTRTMAEWMVKKKVKAVGYDGPNDCTFHMNTEFYYTHKGSPTKEPMHVHRILLSNGILQIEYLCNLTAIKKDRVMFFAVPLKLKTEGSPVRAFAIEE